MQQKLPKRFKAKWIKALLSGDFLQATGTLLEAHPTQSKKPECCCIGVAALVCEIPKADIKDRSFLCAGQYPKKSAMFSNIKKKVPSMLIGGQNEDRHDFNPLINKLATYNDYGKSFKWIAAYIKRYL